jgi:integrase
VLVQEYAALAPSGAMKLRRISVGTIGGRCIKCSGVATPIPKADRLLLALALREKRRPYIYTEGEIRRLLRTALELPSPPAPYRPETVYTMLILAYCAGLRLGEIARLALRNVDLREGALEIRNTKFFKSRRLPSFILACSGVRIITSLSVPWWHGSFALDVLRKALEKADPKIRTRKPPRWKREEGLLDWLDSL